MEFDNWLKKQRYGKCSSAVEMAMRAAWIAGAIAEERKACTRLRELLLECAPMVYANAEALHMLDGFRPQEREFDDLARRLRNELDPNA